MKKFFTLSPLLFLSLLASSVQAAEAPRSSEVSDTSENEIDSNPVEVISIKDHKTALEKLKAEHQAALQELHEQHHAKTIREQIKSTILKTAFPMVAASTLGCVLSYHKADYSDEELTDSLVRGIQLASAHVSRLNPTESDYCHIMLNYHKALQNKDFLMTLMRDSTKLSAIMRHVENEKSFDLV